MAVVVLDDVNGPGGDIHGTRRGGDVNDGGRRGWSLDNDGGSGRRDIDGARGRAAVAAGEGGGAEEGTENPAVTSAVDIIQLHGGKILHEAADSLWGVDRNGGGGGSGEHLHEFQAF